MRKRAVRFGIHDELAMVAIVCAAGVLFHGTWGGILLWGTLQGICVQIILMRHASEDVRIV